MATIQATQEPKPQEFWDVYQQGDFVDAKDNQSDWRVGYIIEKNHHTSLYKVRFDGWSSKYDEYFRFSSAKLAEFRSLIVGYTGQKKNPAIRAEWKFSLPDHELRVKAFHAFFDKPNKSAREINQFVRGHNYFYTDFLMTKTYDSIEAISAVMEYFKLNIKFVVSYIQSIEPNFTQYYKSSENAEDSHLVNPDSAMANAFYEILDTMYIITGSYSRLNGFFNDNTAMIKKYLNIDFEKNVKRYYQMHIFQEFMSCGGFEAVEELIKTKLSTSTTVIPFLFLKSLCSLYHSMGNQISYNDKEPWLKNLVEITKNNIQKLTDKDLKDLNKSHVTQLLETIRQLFANSEEEKEVDQWALETEVDFCHKMILCPFFQKKLKGVVGLIELTDKNKIHPNAADFVKYVIKHKIFQSLFAFDNAEIIKKSAEFCRALYYNDEFPPEVGFKIWEMRVGKHEAALQQIYSLIAILPSRKLTETYAVDLFNEISSVPPEKWDEDYIKMIKEYSISAIGYVGMGEQISHLYGFDILYKYAVAKKNQFSLNALSLFLDRIEKTTPVEEFVHRCFDKISKNEESDIHTCFLLKIIQEQFYSFKDMDPKVSDYIVSDIILNSKDDAEKIEKRFELLTEITRLIGICITYEDFIQLWNEFKGKQSEVPFYSWVLKKKDGGKHQINPRVSSEIRKDIFNSIWASQKEFSNMSERESQIFVEFFKATNITDGNLKRLNILIKTEELEQIVGMETIWDAFETVQSQKIAENLADLIAEVHMNPSKFNQELRQGWVKSLVQIFAKKLTKAYEEKDLERVGRLMTLPRKMIERDEQIFTTKPSKHFMMKDYTVVDKLNKEEKTIRFNVSGYCYDFKKTVAEKFKIPFKRCKISCKGEQIKYENYFRTLNECAFHSSPFEIQTTPPEVSCVKEALNCQLQLFFNLLGNRELERTVWEVMSKLPIASEFVAKISNSEKPWEDINDESIYKQLYIMRVMNYMSQKWWSLFIEGPGLEMLVGKFDRICSKTKIEKEYLKMLCQSISRCLNMPEQTRKIQYETLLLNMFKSLSDLFEALEEEKTQNKSNSVEVQITSMIFSISEKISAHINPLNVLLSSFPKLLSVLSMGLITVDNYFLRKEFAAKLLILSDKLTRQHNMAYLDLIFGSIFNLANDYSPPEKTKQYFTYSSAMIGKCRPEAFKQYLNSNNEELLATVRQNLERTSPEKTIQTINYKLLGNLMLMKVLVKYSSMEFQLRVADFVLFKCFFSHLQKASEDFKCKTKDSRAEALQLLKSIIENGNKIESIIDFLSSQHKSALWRSRKFDDWTLTPVDKIKSASGYVGLKNLGCTCYMNSFFQQIFMISDFKNAILQCEDPLYGREKDTENVLFQVKKMFYNLMNSERKFYSPAGICHSLKNYDGEPTNVTEQMDIDEFSGILFDRLESQMKGTKYENVIKDFFGGLFSNQIICKGCPHFSETEQSFLSVSLSVKTKKNIYQSLDTMIKGDTLEGDNAYFCERCNKKVTAVKRVCLKKLPDHLFLTLKRFEFDYETMNKMKINDYCEFPTELNLKEYSQQYLRKQENPDKFDEEDILPDSYYDYVLKGVAIHIGYADSGHYYSFIKQRTEDGKWYEFNDTTVRGFDPRKLAEQAFGGEVGTFQIKQKIKNAYMLLYERKKKLKDHSDLISPEASLSRNPMYSELSQQIYQENVIQKIESILFSQEYSTFATNLIKASKKMSRQNAIQILKYAVQVYLTVTIRQKEEAVSFEFLKKLQPTILDYPEVSEWILKIFSAQSSLQEFFKNNPAREIKKLLGNWLVEICKLSNEENQEKFIDAILFNIFTATENIPDFCSILYELMKNERLCDYSIKRRVPGLLMDNITRKVIERLKQSNEGELAQLVKANEEDVSKEIGRQILIDKTAYQLSKKPRLNNDSPHVWGILCLAIKRAKALGVQLEEYITPTGLEQLILPSEKLYKILEQARGKFMINQFSYFLSYIAERNQAFSDEIMFLIYRGLKQFQSKRYRQFFTLMKVLLKIEDAKADHRARNGLNFMIKALKDNEKYTLDSNIIQQWIMKLLKKSKSLRKALISVPETLLYLLELSTKKIPTEEVCRKNCYWLECSVNKYHGIKMMKTKKGYLDLSKQTQKFYEDIEKNVEIQAAEWESDEDLTEVQVKPADTISYFDQKEQIDFIEVKVQEVLLGRLWISIDKSKIVPIWKDDQRLTKSNYLYQAEEESEEIVYSENTTEMDGEEDMLVD